MQIALVPLEAERFTDRMRRCEGEYSADLIAAGEEPEVAARHASASLKQAFPEAAPTANNVEFDLVHDSDGVVGYLWVGRDRSGDDSSWWIWDVVIDSEQRGKGYGREAMRLAETYARAEGLVA